MKSFTPHDYQQRAIQFALERGSVGLFLEPGLGKTAIGLTVVKLRKLKKHSRRALVIAPLRVCHHVWPAEAKKWTEFAELKVGVLHGSQKGRTLLERNDVDVINPEGLTWLFRQVSAKDWPWDILIVDESTRFKHTNTQRFKLLRPYLPLFKYRLIFTGTPTPNGLLDLFGQIFILDLGEALGKFITHYRSSYFFPGGYGGYTWLPIKGAAAAIQERIKPRVVAMEAKDYLKLPKLFTIPKLEPVWVELPPKALAQYREMEERFLIELGPNQEAWAANAAAASMKCRQIANGGLYVDEWTGRDNLVLKRAARWERIHEEKTEAVVSLLEELSGKPALIAYDFHHDLDRLLAALGKDTPVLGSGVSAKKEAVILEAWAKGDLPKLLANPQSVARGLNLQGGRAVIFHSLTWNWEDYDQMIRRVWRQGQKHPVFVYHVAARGTVDELILSVLAAKGKKDLAFRQALGDFARGRGVKPRG